MSRATAALRLATWSAFLALALRLLHGSTLGSLSVPAGSLDELSTWADRTSPAVMALAVVRLAALTCTWYLVVATLVLVVAEAAGWHRLARRVGAVCPAVVRRLAVRGAGVGLAAGAVIGGLPMPAPLDPGPRSGPPGGLATPLAPTPATGAPTGPRTVVSVPPPAAVVPERSAATATATMQRVRPASARVVASDGAPDGAPDRTATMTRLPESAPAAASTPPAPAAPRAPAAPPAPAPPAPAPAPAPQAPAPAPAPQAPAPAPAPAPTAVPQDDEWVVAMGDSFWSIAEEAVAEAAPGRAPTGDEVTAYWARLVDANRHRLADPGNPDLLLPGQRLALPAPATG